MSQHPENCSWIYQARRVNTQTAGGGGALTTRISLAAGQVARICAAEIIGTASAGATLSGYLVDEDGANMTKLGFIAAGANRSMYLPSPGSTSSTTDNTVDSGHMVMASGTYLVFASSAALQNETLKVSITLELFNDPTTPTWDTTGSAGTPSLAASTISAANTLVAGRMWT